MLKDQKPLVLKIISNTDPTAQLIAYKNIANTAGMRAMGQLFMHFKIDPERVAREEADAASTLDKRNIEDEAGRTEKVSGLSMPQINRQMQGFTPERSRMEVAQDWMRIYNGAVEKLQHLNPKQFDTPMDIAMIYDYTVRSFGGRSRRQSAAIATSLGAGVNAQAAEDKALAQQHERFETVKQQCIDCWIDMSKTIEPNIDAIEEKFDISVWVSLTVKVADNILKDVIKMEHNMAAYLHLVGGELALKLDCADQLMAECDRLVTENKINIVEACQRGWVIPRLSERLEYQDEIYNCEARLKGYRTARANEKLKKVA